MAISYIFEAREALDTIQDLMDRIDDTEQFYDSLGNDLAELSRQTFDESRDPYGEPWTPLKVRQGQPLRDTGRLMAAITHEATNQYANIGTNTVYARIHQIGGTIKPKKAPYLVFKDHKGGFIHAKEVTIPARPFLPDNRGLPGDWEDALLDTLLDHFNL